MKIEETALPGVKIIEPRVFGDARGWFLETWRQERYRELGIGPDFVQANCSSSVRGVLRGIHFQWPEPQGKLVWVSAGRVFDVAVDIRPESATFRHWYATELDAEHHRQLWIPEGFGHGFKVQSDSASFNYLCTRPYRAEHDTSIAWDDPDIGIDWPLEPAGLSNKDCSAPRLSELARQQLPS